ncbi:hypothetical protein H0H81_005428 [Sphagnurus paluster]|uniref:Probable RNA-binding protein 18 n=1 Tax=Sphagnurus paluster TaxID=117069 RepID=A0A9P7KH76_9AGAR|nr:hypothetical protein H0H81_005428 [Sphagnurus paluster]
MSTRALNDDEVLNQMNKMVRIDQTIATSSAEERLAIVAFIKQEALEKARELKVKADEEFAIEKAKLVKQEQQAIDSQFEKKRKGAEVAQKIAQSNLTNKSRLKLLHRREEHLQDLFATSRAAVVELAKDEGRYVQFLEGIIVQGLLSVLEPTVTVHTRARDVELATQAVENATKTYKEISGRDVQVGVEGTLSGDSAGGVKLVSGSRRITLDNTLDERLRLLEDRLDIIPLQFLQLAMDDTATLELIEHLSFPSTLTESPAESSTAPVLTPRQLLTDRLYVGNLHPTVDEYTLLQVFSKFGKVTKLDFLFHKAGALKGKPRGYAFVEYGSPDEARRALGTAHDKLLRGRKLVVTFAHQAPVDAGGAAFGAKRKTMMETGRPTTLSLLKSGATGGGRHDGTKNKIAMMEAKLRQMESTNPKPKPTSCSSTSSPSHLISTSQSTTTSKTPLFHASLPAKPPPALPTTINSKPHTHTKPKATLPALPIVPPSNLQGRPVVPLEGHVSSAARTARTKLTGVKIGKPKDKDKDKQKDKDKGSGAGVCVDEAAK